MKGTGMVELRVRGVLFDMDGVLMSSLGSVERSWRSYAESRSLNPELAVKMAHGRRAIETVRALRPDLDASSELRIIEDLEIEDNEGLVVYPGVEALLACLAGKLLGNCDFRDRTPGAKPFGLCRNHHSAAFCDRRRGIPGQAPSRAISTRRCSAGRSGRPVHCD